MASGRLRAMLSRLLGKNLLGKTPCSHMAGLVPVEPSSPDSCPACVELGDTWVNLRLCLTCGRVGCCDNSKNRHASKHAAAAGHPIIQSYQPGETWRYCYPHDRLLPDAERPARP
jgi:CPA2 family monovalent cation:H+ antiporter-2